MAEKKNIATGYVGNALRSSAADHTTTFTDEVFDTERQKYQSEMNTDIEGKITSEAEARDLAINTEVQARTQNDQLLSQAIVAEQERAEAAEEANAQAITDEVARAQAAEQANEDAINKLPPMGSAVIIKDSDTNLLLNTTFTDHKYLDKRNGKEVSLNTFSYTDYIDVTGISHLKIYNVPQNGGCFYDEEKNYISGFGFTVSKLNAVIEVPENAVYVRVNIEISKRTDGIAYVMDNSKYPKLVDYPWIDERPVKVKNHWYGKKIVWLGTSIPYGQGTDGVASAPTTYPMQVGNKLGATVVNVARPGMAIETTEDFKRKTYGSLSLTIAELQSQGASTTPYQSYENAMLGQDADLYIFDCEPNNSNWDLTDLENFSVQNWAYNDGSSFESHRNSYVGALLFLIDKLWTEKPSAKVVFVSEYIRGASLDEKYQGLEASKAVAEKLRIPLLDVASKLYYTPLNKSLYLNGDNIHPKQAAHDRIANILSEELLTVS